MRRYIHVTNADRRGAKNSFNYIISLALLWLLWNSWLKVLFEKIGEWMDLYCANMPVVGSLVHMFGGMYTAMFIATFVVIFIIWKSPSIKAPKGASKV